MAKNTEKQEITPALERKGWPNFSDFRVRMTRMAGWGLHPSYSITILGDGRLLYQNGDGIYSEDSTLFSDTLSRTQLKNLLNAFLKIDFFSLKDRYSPDEDLCDTSFTSVFLKWNEKAKEIEDVGIDVPKELTRLQNKIDGLAGAKPYVGRFRELISAKE